jgi:hypothetical protein
MPQIINSSRQSAGKADAKGHTTRNESGIELSGDVTRAPLPLLIGLGVLVLAFLTLMVTHFVGIGGASHSRAGYEKVAPPAGYPDIYPYNSKKWQQAGRPVLSGMPPPQLMQRWTQPGGARTGGKQ